MPEKHRVNARDALRELVERARDEAPGVPTGYSVDERYGMPRPGHLALVVARSSVGKSTFYLNVIARSNAVPTVVFNLEMDAGQQWHWLACISQNMPCSVHDLPAVIRDPGDLRHEDVMNALDVTPDYFPYLHFVKMTKPPSVNDLVLEVDAIQEETGVEVQRVIIDHVSLLQGARDYTGMSLTTAALHGWAQGSRLLVTALQQGGRAGDATGRNNGHLPVTLGSGLYAGESDADIIYGLYRPEKDPKFAKPENNGSPEHEKVRGVTRFSVVKNRFGPTDEVGIPLHFDGYSHRLQERNEQRFPFPEIPNPFPGSEEPF